MSVALAGDGARFCWQSAPATPSATSLEEGTECAGHFPFNHGLSRAARSRGARRLAGPIHTGREHGDHAIADLHGRAAGGARRRRLADAHGQPQGPAVLVADADQQGERRHAQAGLEDQPRHCATKNAACGSFEANAVVADGTYYIQDPFGAVYALDGATGARLWKWTPTYEAGFGVGSGSQQARRRDRRGQGLRRARRRPALRARPAGRHRPLVDGSDAVENGRQDLERSDLRQRHGPHRRLGRRQRRLQRHDAGLHGEQRQAHLVVERDPDRRPARRQDVVRELRRLHQQQHERRRLDVGVTDHRPEAQPRDLRHGQPGSVEHPRPGHEPLHRLDRGAEPLHGPARLVLPDDPPRPVGRRPAEQRRHVHREVQDQGQDGRRVRASPTSTSTG